MLILGGLLTCALVLPRAQGRQAYSRAVGVVLDVVSGWLFEGRAQRRTICPPRPDGRERVGDGPSLGIPRERRPQVCAGVTNATGPQATRLHRNPAGKRRQRSGGSHATLRHLFASHAILVPMRWCTVTVTDPDGRRHSVDVQATSTFDAAHLFVVEAKKERAVGLPKPTLATVFEVVADGKVYRVPGSALQRWIVEKRQTWNGPKGYLFCQRPGLE